jgi:hypothetical protein
MPVTFPPGWARLFTSPSHDRQRAGRLRAGFSRDASDTAEEIRLLANDLGD